MEEPARPFLLHFHPLPCSSYPLKGTQYSTELGTREDQLTESSGWWGELLTPLDVEKATVGILLHFKVINPFFNLHQYWFTLKSICFAPPVCQALWYPGGMMVGKNSHIPWFHGTHGGGHSNPLQCSCLENPVDRGTWQATVQGVTQSWT